MSYELYVKSWGEFVKTDPAYLAAEALYAQIEAHPYGSPEQDAAWDAYEQAHYAAEQGTVTFQWVGTFQAITGVCEGTYTHADAVRFAQMVRDAWMAGVDGQRGDEYGRIIMVKGYQHFLTTSHLRAMTRLVDSGEDFYIV